MITKIPTTDIDDLIADIAVVFHWPPSAYDEMTISELLKWHGLAAARTGQDRTNDRSQSQHSGST
ncbi:GpE family phage tail protein [Morganella morganii]